MSKALSTILSLVKRSKTKVDPEALERSRKAFVDKFGHEPASSIADKPDVLDRWTQGPMKAAPADPGVGYDKYGRPLPKKPKA